MFVLDRSRRAQLACTNQSRSLVVGAVNEQSCSCSGQILAPGTMIRKCKILLGGREGLQKMSGGDTR
jgi:hypothetical protein